MHKYLFGDKIPKKDGAFGSHHANHDNVLLYVLFVVEFIMEPHCELVDLVLAQENITSTKNEKKPME
jgi:hypothetical protein